MTIKRPFIVLCMACTTYIGNAHSQTNTYSNNTKYTNNTINTVDIFNQMNQPTPVLETITVTGNPLNSREIINPVSTVNYNKILSKQPNTLGESLSNLPGISASYFGPNANRPIIRGMENDRIRILHNNNALTDVSGLSYDHAVPIDPLSTERIEILRGPATLLYGGSAIGGVVNIMDNRIPRDPLFDNQGGITGKIMLGAGSGNATHSNVLIETGNDRYALHADAFKRSADNVPVPIQLPCTQSTIHFNSQSICNSAIKSHGVALGGSMFFKQGRIGTSLATYHSNYGTVAEDDVNIGMRSKRMAFDWDINLDTQLFSRINGQLTHSHYQHTEFESHEPSTLFTNKGYDLRLELKHKPLGNMQGIIGINLEKTNFSANGEESFAPYSRTKNLALFALEDRPTHWGKWTLGARTESVKVYSQGNPQINRFIIGSRHFSPYSLALGALWNTAPGWQLSSNISYNQRAPKDYELFANGPHLATHTYEIGKNTLKLEQSTALDFGIKYKHKQHSIGINSFVNQFKNYIALNATGNTIDGLPEYIYDSIAARFTGLEANTSTRHLKKEILL